MTPPVTAALVGALLILLQNALMMNVGLHRGRTGIGVSTGGDLDLERKMRCHGNLAENAALFVAVLALAESLGLPSGFIAWVGGIFVLARVLHVIGFASTAGSHLAEGSKIFLGARAAGTFGTALCGFSLGGYLLYWLIA